VGDEDDYSDEDNQDPLGVEESNDMYSLSREANG
jgi:hypothetical protein